MAAGFIFEPPSDEELGSSPPRDEVDESDDEGDSINRNAQSPWDFGSYTEQIDEEHSRRGTTSIDHKISNAIQFRPPPLPSQEEDDLDSPSPPPTAHVCPITLSLILQRKLFLSVFPTSSVDQGDESDNEEGLDAVFSTETTIPPSSSSFFTFSEGASFHAESFIELNLSRSLLRACEALGYTKPTPIQSACIPLALTGRDICGSAITGSGKTAAFTLPTLERLLYRPKKIRAIRVLILTPTRELAVQVQSMIEKLAQFTDIRCCLIVGGLSTKVQEVALRSMPDIVVATPGRMIDHIRNSMSVDLDDLSVLILDEADRLLELGFSAEIQELVRLCPKKRQTMLFSATMTEQIDELIKLSLTKPIRLSADPSAKRPSTLTEEVIRIRRVREANQEAVLMAICSKTFTSQVIIFSGTKQAAHRLKILFGLAGLKAAELHGNLTQVQRLEALELFRKQEVDFLIATDVAARGLDIIGVKTVVNFACPRDLTSYIHRVGRTARAGREGYAVTLVTDNDRSLLKSIAKRAGSKLKSRIIAEQSVAVWCEAIEQMEEQYSHILKEEREERALRKAEMLAEKAENMVKHREEIFSRPKRTWFATEKEKSHAAKAAKEILENGAESEKVVSAQEAENTKMKDRKRREMEKTLPRKKRRKLQAQRELLHDHDAEMSLVDLGYRRAKAAKKGGKIKIKQNPNPNRTRERNASASVEPFLTDLRVRRKGANFTRSKSKNSFKSKSRYKRR